MKNLHKALALLLGSVMAFTLFAGCGESADNNEPKDPDLNQGGQDDDNQDEDLGPIEGDPAAYVRLCYDNLPDDNVAIPAHETKVVLKGARKIESKTSGVTVDEIVSYDADTGVMTAVGEGIVSYVGADGKKARVEVVPAYPTNPENQYTGTLAKDTSETGKEGESRLGHTHDPSFIEIRKTEGGASEYYLFSTGWADQSNLRINNKSVKTYGNAIHKSKDLITWTFEGRTFDFSTRDEDFVNNTAGKWMYSAEEGTLTTGTGDDPYSSDSASWWAPDIVECPTGGYWLYTCVVDGAGDHSGISVDGFDGVYARACILLYHSDSLDAGSFKPVLFPQGHTDAGKQVVLMQSSIRRGEDEKDVNGIDPQIIYSPDGKMYMAYGSFGSGNYIIELDPQTGMRKDGKGWQTQDTIRHYIDFDNNDKFDADNIQDLFDSTQNPDANNKSIGWEHEYYGTNISKRHMEAPVIARHDNVKVSDETDEYDENGEPIGVEGKTYYYSMHSYDGLGDNYQMWGGRSESPLGVYKSVMGGIVYNADIANAGNEGNKYMGAFAWSGKGTGVKEYDVILTGHNDLYTTEYGVSLAAYITRLPNGAEDTGNFVTQVHQYYLNSLGHIVINPNRYGGEIDREVTEEELFKYTEKDSSNNYKFKMVVMANHRDTQDGDFSDISNVSVDVALTEDGNLLNASGAKIGEWEMYGKGYIKFTFTTAPQTTAQGVSRHTSSGDTVYYGVVRPAWLGDQNKSGFTITCLGATEGTTRSMPLFFNNYSAMTGTDFVG